MEYKLRATEMEGNVNFHNPPKNLTKKENIFDWFCRIGMEVNKNNLFLFVQKYPVGHCIFVIGQKSSFRGNEFTRRAGREGNWEMAALIGYLFDGTEYSHSIQSMFSNNWCKNW